MTARSFIEVALKWYWDLLFQKLGWSFEKEWGRKVYVFSLLWQRQVIDLMLVFIISGCDLHPHLHMQLSCANLALLYGKTVLGLTCVGKSPEELVDSTGHLGECWVPWQGGRQGPYAFVGLGIKRFVYLLCLFCIFCCCCMISRECLKQSSPGTSAKSVYVINNEGRTNQHMSGWCKSFLHLGHAETNSVRRQILKNPKWG